MGYRISLRLILLDLLVHCQSALENDRHDILIEASETSCNLAVDIATRNRQQRLDRQRTLTLILLVS